ncbi:MAG TPA: hypothetical protein VHF26_08415, partial [Trebonia sp.]|nr:hypothetical protein [Trebonia sp.]
MRRADRPGGGQRLRAPAADSDQEYWLLGDVRPPAGRRRPESLARRARGRLGPVAAAVATAPVSAAAPATSSAPVAVTPVPVAAIAAFSPLTGPRRRRRRTLADGVEVIG